MQTNKKRNSLFILLIYWTRNQIQNINSNIFIYLKSVPLKKKLFHYFRRTPCVLDADDPEILSTSYSFSERFPCICTGEDNNKHTIFSENNLSWYKKALPLGDNNKKN